MALAVVSRREVKGLHGNQQRALQPPDPFGRILIVAGFVAFAAAILVHCRFHAGCIIRDVVIYPATVFTGLLVWKERRWLYAVAAVTIAVPGVAFLDWAALTNLAGITRFLNHLFLFLAVVLAAAGAISGLVGKRQG